MAFLAPALLDPVCERLFNAALEGYELARDVKEEVRKLGFTVSLIRELLQDAEEKQVKEEVVCVWLRALKQVLYDAEDILDEVATDSALEAAPVDGSPSVTSVKAQVCNAFPGFGSIGKIMSGHDLAHQIKTIRMQLDDLYKEKDALSLQVMSTGDVCPINDKRRRVETSSLMVDEPCIVGRDDEKRKIIQMLTGSENWGSGPTGGSKNVKVLALVGMGGVGKTTLAKLVFDDRTVRQHFHVMIWVCVSENFDLKRMTKEIMDAVSSCSTEQRELFEISNWDSAQRRLRDKLEEQKFLLVLDDMWEQDPFKWESLYGPLGHGREGSRVIVTTRNQRVSDMVKAFCIHLRSLSDEELWPIFKSYAFDGSESYVHAQLEPMGRQMVRKLKGSPLAAKTIGRLLNRSLDVRHWKNILQSEIFMLEQHPNDISPVLKLSYDHLPGHLKQCFAYCSLFPKDYLFDKEELVHHWMAQQFVQNSGRHPQGQSIAGDQYFDDLLYMSFYERRDNYTKKYIMHDLIHDMAESISEDDCFRLGDDLLKEIPETVRHVSIATNNLDQAKLMELCKHGSLRTLLFLSRCRFELSPHLDSLFMQLKRLRVLSLRDCRILELPKSIGTLKHLRYFDLSDTNISELPESFCHLYNLQVLKLRGCWRLSALPSNMSALVNLILLEAGPKLVSGIPGLGKLTALQEITIRCGTSKVKELGAMSMLRVLGIQNLEQVGSKDEAAQARLDVKGDLYELYLGWEGDRADHPTDQEILEGLRPVDSIRQLFINGYGGVSCPTWLEGWSSGRGVSSYSLLERMKLQGCPNLEVLPPLGQLHRLKSLEISWMRKLRQIGPQFPGCGADTGGGLDVPRWEEEEEKAISSRGDDDCTEDDGNGRQTLCLPPRLHTLGIEGCPRLKELPPLPHTLETLRIRGVGLIRLPRLMLDCGGGGGGVGTGQIMSPPSSSSSSSAPSLSSLEIINCPDLMFLNHGLLEHPDLPKLSKLFICRCQRITALPSRALAHLTSLRSLVIAGCPKLSYLRPSAREEDDALPCSLEDVTLDDCGDMVENLLPASLPKLTSLSALDVTVGTSTGTTSTAALLGSMQHATGLTSTLKELRIRRIRGDRQGEARSSSCSLPGAVPPLEGVRPSIRCLTSLTSLHIQDCSDLLQVSSPLPSSLERLRIEDDRHMDDRLLSAWLQGQSSLRSLKILGCPLLTSLPTSDVKSHPSAALECLEISECKELKTLGCVHTLASLRELTIERCPKLLRLVESATATSPSSSSYVKSHPTAALERLVIRRCKELKALGCVHTLASLRELAIEGCPKLLRLVESATATSPPSSSSTLSPSADMLMRLKSLRIVSSSPRQILMCLRHCPSLQELEIRSCPQLLTCSGDHDGGDGIGGELEAALLDLAPSLRNLKFLGCDDLRCLPSNLRCLSSLERLSISGCPQVQSLPQAGLPESLEHLSINGCPALEERCAEEGGPDRPLISGIRHLYLY